MHWEQLRNSLPFLNEALSSTSLGQDQILLCWEQVRAAEAKEERKPSKPGRIVSFISLTTDTLYHIFEM